MTKEQITLLSGYLADISKILIGSVVVAFFLLTGPAPIDISTFLIGVTTAVLALIMSIVLLQ